MVFCIENQFSLDLEVLVHSNTTYNSAQFHVHLIEQIVEVSFGSELDIYPFNALTGQLIIGHVTVLGHCVKVVRVQGFMI